MVARTITLGLLAFFGASAAHGNCVTPFPTPAPLSTLGDVTPLDLARLRDIGPSPVMFLYDSPIGVSPDGRRIAFQMRRADPASNSYCLAIYVYDLGGPSLPRMVDQGGDLIRRNVPDFAPAISSPRASTTGLRDNGASAALKCFCTMGDLNGRQRWTILRSGPLA
jgi:hypothetical protein